MGHQSQLRFKSLWVFPIKSCRGIEMQESGFSALGLDWMIVSEGNHQFLTARTVPRMVLLTPTLDLETSTLNLTIPSTSSAASSTHTIPFAAPPSAPHHTTFGIWGSRFDGYEVGDSALLSALSAFFGKPVLLVLKGHENRPAAVVAEWRESEGVTGLYGREMEPPMTRWSDKAPILLVCEESRKDVGERIELRERGSGGRWEGRGASLEMERWRGNVVMEGAEEPWEEDGWEDLRFGSGEGDTFEWLVSSRCSRCMLPNVDPATGVRDKVVPDKVLRPFREFQWPMMGEQACFGVFAVPKPGARGIIRVGDTVKVLKTFEKRADGSGFDRVEDGSSGFDTR